MNNFSEYQRASYSSCCLFYSTWSYGAISYFCSACSTPLFYSSWRRTSYSAFTSCLVASVCSYLVSSFSSYLTSSLVSYFTSTFGDSALGSTTFYFGSFIGCFPVFLAVVTRAGAGPAFFIYTGFLAIAGVFGVWAGFPFSIFSWLAFSFFSSWCYSPSFFYSLCSMGLFVPFFSPMILLLLRFVWLTLFPVPVVGFGLMSLLTAFWSRLGKNDLWSSLVSPHPCRRLLVFWYRDV